jgi:hypothetical protein
MTRLTSRLAAVAESPRLRSATDVLRFSSFMLLLVFWLLWSIRAQAHSWYPWECCSDRDCAPIAVSETPIERDGGFYLNDGRHISYKEVKPSPDGLWHLCEEKWPERVSDRKILCVWAPIGGV